MVEDGVSGRIVERADDGAMAAAILEYLGEAPRAAAHGRAGRRAVEQRFSIDRMVQSYDRLYADALARGPAARA
jgi:glycosyltransferase involved in cell wall biosynthesis